jgi:hypothetical protein
MLTLVCGAFLGTLPIYLVIAWTVAEAGGFATGLPDAVPWALAIVGVAALVAAGFVTRSMVRQGFVATAGPAERTRLYVEAVAIGFIIRDAGAACGFVATLLTGELWWCALLCLASLVAMLAGWPGRRSFDRMAAGPSGPEPVV